MEIAANHAAQVMRDVAVSVDVFREGRNCIWRNEDNGG